MYMSHKSTSNYHQNVRDMNHNTGYRDAKHLTNNAHGLQVPPTFSPNHYPQYPYPPPELMNPEPVLGPTLADLVASVDALNHRTTALESYTRQTLNALSLRVNQHTQQIEKMLEITMRVVQKVDGFENDPKNGRG